MFLLTGIFSWLSERDREYSKSSERGLKSQLVFSVLVYMNILKKLLDVIESLKLFPHVAIDS